MEVGLIALIKFDFETGKQEIKVFILVKIFSS